MTVLALIFRTLASRYLRRARCKSSAFSILGLAALLTGLMIVGKVPCFAASEPEFADPSFETPSIGACPNLEYAPGGTPWTFNSAGITTGGCNARFNAPALPPGGGTQAAFIQGNGSSISQTVDGFESGQSYQIIFYAAGRPTSAGCDDNCTEINFSVSVGSIDVLDVTAPPTGAFQRYTTKPFTAVGAVTITFTGIVGEGQTQDAASFIDLLMISNELCTSETVATVPQQSPSRTTIGVAEVVVLKAQSAAQWTLDGDGFLSEPSNGTCSLATSSTAVEGAEACFTAPYVAASSTVTAEIEGGPSCPITFHTIAPSGVAIQRVIAPGYAFKNNKHTGISASEAIGMWTAAFLLPGTVSFANVGIAEQDQKKDSDNYIIARQPPLLVKIAGSPGWLLNCDLDALPMYIYGVSNDQSVVSPWVYAWGFDPSLTPKEKYAMAQKQKFTYVETKLFHAFDFWLYQKGQVRSQGGPLNALYPFIQAFASLPVRDSADHSELGELNSEACLTDVQQQFAPDIVR